MAVIQLEVDERLYSSVDEFRARIAALVDRALANGQPDLIVFPEYTCAFLALIPYRRAIEGSRSVAEAFEKARAADPRFASLRELFLQEADGVERAIRDVFGTLARQHGAAMIAGTAFARTRGSGSEELRNRAYVFASDGSLLYTQDKVSLTDFETDLLLVSPGSLEDARTFSLAGARVGLTICRDTFMEEWETAFRGLDLWIDIKANGAPYTEEARQEFQKALPERLPGSGVRYGITACLVGRLLDIVWEGESSFIELDSGVVRARARSESWTGYQGLVVSLEL